MGVKWNRFERALRPGGRFLRGLCHAALFLSHPKRPLFRRLRAWRRIGRSERSLAGIDPFLRRYDRRDLPQARPEYAMGAGAFGRAQTAGFPDLPRGGFARRQFETHSQKTAALRRTIRGNESRFSPKADAARLTVRFQRSHPFSAGTFRERRIHSTS